MTLNASATKGGTFGEQCDEQEEMFGRDLDGQEGGHVSCLGGQTETFWTVNIWEVGTDRQEAWRKRGEEIHGWSERGRDVRVGVRGEDAEDQRTGWRQLIGCGQP